MPNPYQNPPNKPPIGNYQWVPSTPPTGGETPVGYLTTDIERGKFRNDIPVINGHTNGTVQISYGGSLQSITGSENWPILAAFRPLADPANVLASTPTDPCIVTGSDFFWQVDIKTPVHISAITFTYNLIIDATDENILQHMEQGSDDYNALLAYQKKPTGNLNIDWSKYMFMQILGTDNSGKTVEYPTPGSDNVFLRLSVTDYLQNTNVYAKVTVTVKFADITSSSSASSFPILKTIKFVNRYQLSSLTFSLYKMMIFNASGVNIRSNQLPCSLLGYAMPVAYYYDPSGNPVTPTSGTKPNIHVKVFNPDSLTGSPGFAHSLSLRFLVIAAPVATDIIGNILDGNTYFVIFTGPSPSQRTVTYSMTSSPTNLLKGMAIPLDYYSLRSDVTSIKIQKSNTPGANPPSNSATWTDLTNNTYIVTNPPGFTNNGPWVSPFLYWDTSGTVNDWYRIIQILKDGTQYNSTAYRGQIYTENNSLKLLDVSTASMLPNISTITRRIQVNINPLNSNPIALFYSTDDTNPYASPVVLEPGPWSVSFNAASIDPSNYATSHLYARFWFVPEDYTIDMNNPHYYRNLTEIYFKLNADNTTSLIQGTPNDLSECLVSPPLPNTQSYLNLVRYVNNTLNLTLPFNGKRGRLVVGIYQNSVLNLTDNGTLPNINNLSVNWPQFKLNIDSNYMNTSTMLTQVISYNNAGGIYPVKANNFNSSHYTQIAQPLTATYYENGGNVLTPDTTGYVKYNSIFQSNTGQNIVTNSFEGLATLQSAPATSGKFYIPYDVSIPQTIDLGNPLIADFCTNVSSFNYGKVQTGTWSIDMTINTGSDTSLIACKYRFDAMLVSIDGLVMERIFRSSLLESNGGDVSYNLNIQIPFLMSSTSQQLIIRVYAYPYSANGKILDINTIQDNLKKENKPFGVRIDSLTLQLHTLYSFNISQNDSVLGSPAFYEDLPLVPANALDSQMFWFHAASDLTNTQIVSQNPGLYISGCLYSPSWFVDLPSNMEVKFGAQGYSGSSIWFRTVPATGVTSKEFSISAAQHKISKNIHVVAHEISSTNSNISNIRYYKQPMHYSPVIQNELISGINGNNTSYMQGKNPNLIFTSFSKSNQKANSLLSITAQVDENTSPSINTAVNAYNGETNRWSNANSTFLDTEFGVNLNRLTQGLSNISTCISNNGNILYIVGYAQPGTIILKLTNLNIVPSNGNIAPGNLYIVDGNKNVENIPDNNPIVPFGSLSGNAVNTFPGLCVNKNGIVTVGYTIQGQDGLLYARQFNGSTFGDAYVIVNFRKGTIASTNIAISGINLQYDHYLNKTFCAFWCGGKVFVTTVTDYIQGLGAMNDYVQFVAGNNNFGDSSNPSNPYFAAMKTSGYLIVPDQSQELDIPKQRVGLFISNQSGYQGNLFVYYKDSKSNLQVRRVIYGSQTCNPIPLL